MQVFSEYGGEHHSRSIAKTIVRARSQGQPITTTDQLVGLILRIKGPQRGKIHPATKVFQALRIAVNDELTSIQAALPMTLELLEPGSRIVTIAFHEGEDRIVKQLFRAWEASRKGHQPIKKPLVPTKQEQNRNPRSRSAKLRIFEKKI
jgi:16S rRNA (cytosine1402-N4)-methyltransferase